MSTKKHQGNIVIKNVFPNEMNMKISKRKCLPNKNKRSPTKIQSSKTAMSMYESKGLLSPIRVKIRIFM